MTQIFKMNELFSPAALASKVILSMIELLVVLKHTGPSVGRILIALQNFDDDINFSSYFGSTGWTPVLTILVPYFVCFGQYLIHIIRPEKPLPVGLV